MFDEPPEGTCGFSTKYPLRSPYGPGPELSISTCRRETWDGEDRCYWHAEMDEKPIKIELLNNLEEGENIDGAIFRNCVFPEGVSFEGVTVRGADFSGAEAPKSDFSEANLSGTDLSSGRFIEADFTETTLHRADFTDSVLWGSTFLESNSDPTKSNLEDHFIDEFYPGVRTLIFKRSECVDADFSDANFSNSDLHSAKLEGATLDRTNFSNSNFQSADLSEVNSRGGEFSNANIFSTDLTGAVLRHCDFSDTYSCHADFTNTDLRWSIFRDADLRDASLVRADIRNADFENTELYQTIFSDARLNEGTKFGEYCIYDQSDSEFKTGHEGVDDPSTAAIWVYRRLESLYEENAMANEVRHYHICKEEAQRKQHKEQGQKGKYAVATANRYLTYHGESVFHILGSSAIIIVVSGLLYPFLGGIRDGSTVYQIQMALKFPTFEGLVTGLEVFARSIYFSVITFSTIGYANVAPHGPWSRVLVGIESLLGAILVALFVYVLGRRVAR